MKYLAAIGVIGLALFLIGVGGLGVAGYKKPIDFDSGQSNGLIKKPEIHPCNGIEKQARRLHEVIQSSVKTEDDLLALLNNLQKEVKKNPEFVILQQAAQFMFDEGDVVPEIEKFAQATKAACVKKFGPVMDRNNV